MGYKRVTNTKTEREEKHLSKFHESQQGKTRHSWVAVTGCATARSAMLQITSRTTTKSRHQACKEPPRKARLDKEAKHCQQSKAKLKLAQDKLSLTHYLILLLERAGIELIKVLHEKAVPRLALLCFKLLHVQPTREVGQRRETSLGCKSATI